MTLKKIFNYGLAFMIGVSLATADVKADDWVAEIPTADVPAVDVPAVDVPTADVPMVDVPMLNVPTVDVPMVEIPTADVPMMDVPMVEIPTADVPAVDMPAEETPAEELPLVNIPAEETPVKDVRGGHELYGHTEQELIFVTALNEYRAARGLHPVQLNAELSRDCRAWSTRMRQSGRLSHDPMGGTEICAQITHESGINALQAWQRSPAHNAILLSSRIDTIGIGSDGIWWTMRGRMVHEVPHYTERTVPGITDAGTEVTDVLIGRVPMSVSARSVPRATGDVPGSARTVPPHSGTDAETEVTDVLVGRVPMSVSAGSVQRAPSSVPGRVNTLTPLRLRIR